MSPHSGRHTGDEIAIEPAQPEYIPPVSRLPAPASNGCSQPTRHAPKWAAPTHSLPMSHNHCAEPLVCALPLPLLAVHIALQEAESVPEHVERRAHDRGNMDLETVDVNLRQGNEVAAQGTVVDPESFRSVPIEALGNVTERKKDVDWQTSIV